MTTPDEAPPSPRPRMSPLDAALLVGLLVLAAVAGALTWHHGPYWPTPALETVPVTAR